MRHMKKYRMRPIKSGKGTRMGYQNGKDVVEMPNLIAIQTESFKWFREEGLKDAFLDVFPINDKNGKLTLDFVDYKFDESEIKYPVEECKERDVTYSVPLKVNVRLTNHETGEINQHEVFMGDMPWMTNTGTFVINGAERVIVSQLVRSPGIYYTQERDKDGRLIYKCQIIPNRGAWIEYETAADGEFVVKIDRGRKQPVTDLIRSLKIGENSTNTEIADFFGIDILDEGNRIVRTFAKDVAGNYADGLQEVYKRLRPGEPFAVETASGLLRSMFYDDTRYDLAKVGRYKYNKKLALQNRIANFVLAEDVIDPMTGEVMFKKGTEISREDAKTIQNAAVERVKVQGETGDQVVISNLSVDIEPWIADRLPGVTAEDLGIHEAVYFPVLQRILDDPEFADDAEGLRNALELSVRDLVPRHITREDILASVNYLLNLEDEIGEFDDIDHLGNRRIKSVGELLQNQFKIGLSRMEKNVVERMGTQDIDTLTPQTLMNTKPVTAAVKEFFSSSPMSQFMDQNNPLAELTNKRRLSALGPGGLSRERAGFEVRDVHYTHYGRMCPVETPEGPNIGLINSLASYARINEYGFIEAPYRVVDNKTDPENPVVTDEVRYMTADEEDNYYIAQASEELDKDGHFVRQNVAGRHREDTSEFPRRKISFMDVSPRMIFSVATSMVPFLQNDDATRALMGSNMQRQAVPLMVTDSPIVGTGMEQKTAVDSGICVLAEHDGTVTYSAADKIIIKRDDNGEEEEYKVLKFQRTNQDNSMNQRSIVFKGEHVSAGDVIADGASTKNGELALGKNPLIGFTTWEGYNYEDAVLLSEKLVRDDVYTSIHIQDLKCDARAAKPYAEEITRDIPQVSAELLKNLDENGIIRIGSEVHSGDYLVGKVTPKGETREDSYEKLTYSIYSERAKEVKDTSLKVPHGSYGVVMDVKVYSRENGDELPPGVLQSVRIYIAQKRKISVGDKMAGRHGNKGVVSRVLPVEDMPFLPNGRSLDICLNPLGVPSRMNIGQVMELHLGLAANVLGFKVSTPIFDGAHEEDIDELLLMANDYVNTSWEDFAAKYEKKVNKDVMTYLYENRDYRKEWAGVPLDETGKVQLRDGRTGEPFPSKVSVGFMYYLKLHHLVDDKIHARSTGPYALVTRQPLGGKAQFGGQRFGEMEVWALEAYGAAYTLQEMLTIKSDDKRGRDATVISIWNGQNLPKPGLPESFKVLVKEFQSLCLDVTMLDADDQVVELEEARGYKKAFAEEDAQDTSAEAGFGQGTIDSTGDINYDENAIVDDADFGGADSNVDEIDIMEDQDSDNE